jgi:hypothetical protein
MIGLLDPALFLPRADQEVQRELDLVLLACKKHSIELLPLEEYWLDLWSILGRRLETTLKPDAKRPLQELRKLGERGKPTLLSLPMLSTLYGKAWRSGFRQLFAATWLGNSWEDRMASAVLRVIVADRAVVVFTRRVPGRNLQLHAAGGSTLEENTRWLLHVQPKGIGHRQIPCVYHPRNLSERWTTRFDWRLPTVSDGALYPFCPPNRWWKPSTIAFRTVSSKPSWVDKWGNGWARPNIPNGAGYHWDVFIQDPSLEQVVGLPQINVVEFGAPASEGAPGQRHHLPTKKDGKLTGKGWNC